MFVPPLGNPPGVERRLRDWHEARFSSGPTGDQPAFDAFWQDLYRAGAEVVLAGWAAGSGYYSIGKYGFITWANHMIMPWVVLSLLFAANYARMSRGNLIETMSEDYIRTARAKGLT